MDFVQLFERARLVKRRALVEPLVYDTIQKRDPSKCWVRGCSKPHGYKRRLCSAHTMLKFRHDNPVEYRYNAIRDRARRKKIPMTLTIDEWWDFCEKNPDFLSTLPATKDTFMEVDRVDGTKGYHIWNIQPLTREENASKGWHERNDPQHQEHMKLRRLGLAIYDEPPEGYAPLPEIPDGEDPY